MKGEADGWGARGMVLGKCSFFRFLLAGAAGDEMGGGDPLLAPCAVGGTGADAPGAEVEELIGVEVEVDGALDLRGLRFFFALISECAGVKEEAESGRKGKKSSNIIGSRERQACA